MWKRSGAAMFALVIAVSCTPDQQGQIVGTPTPQTAACRIVRVVDGDTVDFVCPGGARERGRLIGFDTPEIHSPRCAAEQRLGLAATVRLEREIAAAGRVDLRFAGRDRYDRRLVSLYLDGVDAADIMVGAGLARRYSGGYRQGWCA